jgi:hypothetical protein
VQALAFWKVVTVDNAGLLEVRPELRDQVPEEILAPLV